MIIEIFNQDICATGLRACVDEDYNQDTCATVLRTSVDRNIIRILVLQD